jgi:hypothetical protein
MIEGGRCDRRPLLRITPCPILAGLMSRAAAITVAS